MRAWARIVTADSPHPACESSRGDGPCFHIVLWRALLAAAALLAMLWTTAALAQPAPACVPESGSGFTETFDTQEVGAEWSYVDFGSYARWAQRQGSYLGEFAPQTVELRLRATGGQVTMEFDLLIIRTWDGLTTDPIHGPDYWQASLDGGPILLKAAFSAGAKAEIIESSGGSIADPVHNTAGFDYDSVHRVRLTFSPPSQDFSIVFQSTVQGQGGDESWGLDQLQVTGAVRCQNATTDSDPCPLEAVWHQVLEGRGASQWTINSRGEAVEAGLGNATGTATLVGRLLTILFEAPTGHAGSYSIVLADDCTKGEGLMQFTRVPDGDSLVALRSVFTRVDSRPPELALVREEDGAFLPIQGAWAYGRRFFVEVRYAEPQAESQVTVWFSSSLGLIEPYAIGGGSRQGVVATQTSDRTVFRSGPLYLLSPGTGE